MLLIVDEALFALRQPFGDLLGEALLPRHELGIAAKQDVRPAAGHVRGDGDGALSAGLCDDLGFLRVVLRVEHDVLVESATGGRPALESAPVEHGRDTFGLLDRNGADEHRPSLLVLLDDLGDDGVPFLAFGAIDEIGILDAGERPVRRNDDDVEIVDLGELFGLGVGRAGHAGELLVLAKVVLERDRGERLVLALDLDLLLGLDRLMQTVAPAAPRHETPGELVDDDDLAVLHHVVDIELEQRVRPQRLIDVVLDVRVLEVVDVPAVETVGEHLLGLHGPALGERHRLVLLVDEIVAGLFECLTLLGFGVAARDGAGLEPRNNAIDLVVEVGRLFGRAGDDERRARFVDEDAVDFVHDGEVMPALHVVRELELHVVAQVVEPELVVGAVGDVGRIGHLTFGVVQVVLDDADAHAKKAEDPAHPFGVAPCQVVVDSDDVDPVAARAH